MSQLHMNITQKIYSKYTTAQKYYPFKWPHNKPVYTVILQPLNLNTLFIYLFYLCFNNTA